MAISTSKAARKRLGTRAAAKRQRHARTRAISRRQLRNLKEARP